MIGKASPITKKLNELLDKLSSSIVVFWLFWFAIFVLKAKEKIGHWPYYAHPDPVDLGMDFHYASLWFGAYLVFWVTLAKLINFYSKNINLFLLLMGLLLFGVFLILLGGEFSGLILWTSYMLHLPITIWTIIHIVKKKKFDSFSLFFGLSLIVFWLHNILDPFKYINWFLD